MNRYRSLCQTLLLLSVPLWGFSFVGRAALPTTETSGPLEFKTLLIIKKNTALPANGDFPGSQTQLSNSEIQKINTTYERFAANWVRATTQGAVRWSTEVKVVDTPLASSTPCTQSPGVRVTWNDLRKELSADVESKKYDSIFYYVSIPAQSSGRYLICEAGDTLPREVAIPTGISVIYRDRFDRDSWRTETFLHEWGHQLTALYAPLAVPLPACGPGIPPIHCAKAYGYRPGADSLPGVQHWSEWLADFFNGKISDPHRGFVGLGPKAWAYGSMLQRTSRPPLSPPRPSSAGSGPSNLTKQDSDP